MENTVFLVEIFWMTNSKAFILSQYPQALMTEYAGGEPYMRSLLGYYRPFRNIGCALRQMDCC